MRLFAVVVISTILAAPAKAQEVPLTALPYSPSLDLSSLDRTVDPCVDFYQFSCGGWRAKNPIPSDQASWGVYEKLSEENNRYLWGILEEASKPGTKRTPAQQKIGDYFAACTNVARIDALGDKPLRPLLAQIDKLKNKSELAGFLGSQPADRYGSQWLFGFAAEPDFRDATQVIAYIRGGGLGLPDRDYYMREDAGAKEIRAKYLKHVARMFEMIGEDPKKAASDAEAVMRFETNLAAASLTRTERRDPYNLDHRMTPAELQALTPSFDWKRFLGSYGLESVANVNLTQPRLFEAIEKAIKTAPLSDWKTYLRWRAVHARAPYLSQKFVAEDFDFYRKTLRGVTEMPPRWKTCVRYVDRDLGEALGQEFVRRTFAPATKERAVTMTKGIEKAMEQEIRSLDWMSEPTTDRALEKLRAVANKIGYPDRWRDYSALEIDRRDFYGDVSRAIRFESNRDLRKIGKRTDRSEWNMTPPTVNAYYSAQFNDMNFPAGILQPPLFDPKMDDAPNYGNTGSTIGHELTHGFDDQGRKFDAFGNLTDWWTAADAKAFEERVSCVRDQYAQYTVVDDIKINSKLTAGEDVADLGGTLLAWLAWAATNGSGEEPIDGFTPEQRFFIGNAQWACSNERPENLRVNAITDTHSPPRHRVNGVVTNLPQFRKAFGCAANAPMVREDVCKVW